MKKHNLIPIPEVQTLSLDIDTQNLHQECQEYFGPLPVIQMQQVHGAKFHEIIDKPAQNLILPDVDGVITTLSDVVLSVRTADCLPILVYHPSGLIGAVHAGRKGTQQQILEKLLIHLYQEKQITRDLQLWFGPAICETCYQIDEAIDLHFSLIKENIKQLKNVYPEDCYSLTIDSACTQEQLDLHSYRREGTGSGSNYSLITKKRR